MTADLLGRLWQQVERRLPADELRRRRLIGMARGAASSLSNRVLTVVISLISVPLTIGYLGIERYGAWVTIGAALTWMTLTDFGLGTGLTNAVTADAHRDRPDKVRMHLSNFVALVTVIAAAVGGIALFAWPMINWGSLFGVTRPETLAELRVALAIALVLFLVRMPLSMAGKVYIAYQEGHVGNRWAAAGSVLSLVMLLVVTQTRGGLPALVLAVYGTAMLVDAASSLWLFARHRPAVRPHWRAIRIDAVGQIGAVGGQFFLITIMALVTFQSDTLVIAHFLGAGAVPGYSVPYQLFNYAVLPQTLIFPYLWSAFTEAITRGDIDWVRRTFRLYVAGSVAVTVAIALTMLVLARPFIGWWTHGAVNPVLPLIALMAAWSVINAYSGAVSCLLAAASHLRYQLVYSALATIANLVFSIILVQRIGVTGVIGSTVGAYLLLLCGPTWLDASSLLRRLARTHPAPERPGTQPA